jgi:hypothetical protein
MKLEKAVINIFHRLKKMFVLLLSNFLFKFLYLETALAC